MNQMRSVNFLTCFNIILPSKPGLPSVTSRQVHGLKCCMHFSVPLCVLHDPPISRSLVFNTRLLTRTNYEKSYVFLCPHITSFATKAIPLTLHLLNGLYFEMSLAEYSYNAYIPGAIQIPRSPTMRVTCATKRTCCVTSIRGKQEDRMDHAPSVDPACGIPAFVTKCLSSFGSKKPNHLLNNHQDDRELSDHHPSSPLCLASVHNTNRPPYYHAALTLSITSTSHTNTC